MTQGTSNVVQSTGPAVRPRGPHARCQTPRDGTPRDGHLATVRPRWRPRCQAPRDARGPRASEPLARSTSRTAPRPWLRRRQDPATLAADRPFVSFASVDESPVRGSETSARGVENARGCTRAGDPNSSCAGEVLSLSPRWWSVPPAGRWAGKGKRGVMAGTDPTRRLPQTFGTARRIAFPSFTKTRYSTSRALWRSSSSGTWRLRLATTASNESRVVSSLQRRLAST